MRSQITLLMVFVVLASMISSTIITEAVPSEHFGEIGSFTVTTDGGMCFMEWMQPSMVLTSGAQVERYEVYRSVDDFDHFVLLATLPASQTNYTDTDPPFGEVCFYQLLAVAGDDTYTSRYEPVGIGRTVPSSPDQTRCLAGDSSAFASWAFGPAQMGGTVSSSFILYGGYSATTSRR